jgi:hypothetical protein
VRLAPGATPDEAEAVAQASASVRFIVPECPDDWEAQASEHHAKRAEQIG